MRQIKIAADDRPLGRSPAAKPKQKAKAKTQKRRSAQKNNLSVGATFAKVMGALASGFSASKSLFNRLPTSKKGAKGRAAPRRRGPRSWQRVSAFGGGIAAIALMVG